MRWKKLKVKRGTKIKLENSGDDFGKFDVYSIED